MGRSRYTAEIDLEDLNSSHTLAILQVPPGSLVLDIGAADGSVARGLGERGCAVVAIEKDPDAARAAGEICARVLCEDVETIDLTAALQGFAFDWVLLLDVLEHLRDPVKTLKAAAAVLKPEGRMVLSVPNVTHAALRLSLLSGRFTYTDTGLLDRTHLHLFDRSGLERLIERGGLVVLDRMRTTAGLTETEVSIEPDSFPREAVGLALTGDDATVYQFVYVVAPGTAQRNLDQPTPLGEALQRRALEAERARADAEGYIQKLEARIAELEAGSAAQAQLEQELQNLNRELDRTRDALRSSKMDVEIKDAQLAYLQSELAKLHDRLDRAGHRLLERIAVTTTRVPMLHRGLRRAAGRIDSSLGPGPGEPPKDALNR